MRNYHVHEWVATQGGVTEMCRHCSETRFVEAKTYARGDAHDTELAAADRAQYRAGTDKARLLTLIRKLGPCTTDELSVRMVAYDRPDRPNMYASRILDLVEDGYLEDSKERRKTRTGSPAIVWRIIE